MKINLHIFYLFKKIFKALTVEKLLPTVRAKFSMFLKMFAAMKARAGESHGRAPGQASDYTLRAPNPLDSRTMKRRLTKISSPLNSSGPRYFAPPAPPLSPALMKAGRLHFEAIERMSLQTTQLPSPET